MDKPARRDAGTGSSWQSGASGSAREGGSGARESPQFSTDFYMYCYKILPCAKRHSHDWASCPHAHSGEKACRRDPRQFNYQPAPCPANSLGAPCPQGAACPFAHNLYECWLHPNRFRTQFCQKGVECTRPLCFFAHSIDELRFPEEQASELPIQLGPAVAAVALGGTSTDAGTLQQQLMGQAALGINIGVPQIANVVEGMALASPLRVRALAGSSMGAAGAAARLVACGAPAAVASMDVAALPGAPRQLLQGVGPMDTLMDGFTPKLVGPRALPSNSSIAASCSSSSAGDRLPIAAAAAAHAVAAAAGVAQLGPVDQQLSAMELSGGLGSIPTAKPTTSLVASELVQQQGVMRRISATEQQRLAAPLSGPAPQQSIGGGLLHEPQQTLSLAQLALLQVAENQQQQQMQQQPQPPLQDGRAPCGGRSMVGHGIAPAVPGQSLVWPPAVWQDQAHGSVLPPAPSISGNPAARSRPYQDGEVYQDGRQLLHVVMPAFIAQQQQQHLQVQHKHLQQPQQQLLSQLPLQQHMGPLLPPQRLTQLAMQAQVQQHWPPPAQLHVRQPLQQQQVPFPQPHQPRPRHMQMQHVQTPAMLPSQHWHAQQAAVQQPLPQHSLPHQQGLPQVQQHYSRQQQQQQQHWQQQQAPHLPPP